MEQIMKRAIKAVLGVMLIGAGLVVAGCGGNSEVTAGLPQATANQPAGITTIPAPAAVAAVGGINSVTLSWEPVAGADSYNIYWSENPGVTPATGTRISGATSPYRHAGLFVSRTYFYVVTAVNSSGESAASSLASTVSANDSANLYDTHCARCHGSLVSTTIMEGTSDKITAAIAADSGGMGVLSALTAHQIDLISQQLPCH